MAKAMPSVATVLRSGSAQVPSANKILTSKGAKGMPAYVLVTHGRNSGSDDPRKYDGATTQVRALTQIHVKQHGKVPRQWFCDYRRKINDLTELPVLMKLLSAADRQGVAILMDDVRRIFGICPALQRPDLLKQLMATPGADRRIGLRQGGHFFKSAQQNAKQFMIWDGHLGLPSKIIEDDRPDYLKRAQTHKGTRVSAKRRSIVAARNDQALADLKAKLKQQGKKVTNKALAEAANENGLTTAKGTLWSDKSVSRALGRHAKRQS